MDEEKKRILENKEKAYKNALKEKVMIQKNIDNLNNTIPLFHEELAITRAQFDVIHKPENFRLLNPNWAYEQDPDYINNLVKLAHINKKKSEIMADQKLKEFEDSMNRLQEQMSQLLPYIDTLVKEIESLKESD